MDILFPVGGEMTLNMHASARERIEAFFREAAYFVGNFDPQAVKLFLDINPSSLSHAIVERLQDGPVHSSHERTINGAGFKMFSEVDADGNVWIRLGGDQTKNHPEAYLVMTTLLKKHGLLPEERFDGSWAPLCNEWLVVNWLNLKDWAWEWVREHPELLPDNVGKFDWSLV